MRGIFIDVYRCYDAGSCKERDCTNGGISSKYNRLLLVCDSGNIDIDEDNHPENLVKAVTFGSPKNPRVYIAPYSRPMPNHTGWMFGGNLAYSSDSRFPSKYPLKIFDRQETVEDYLSYD